MWARWRRPAPSYAAQARQLTEARREFPWLAAGSQVIQQQALRDHERAWQCFFRGTHGRPGWRKRHQHEGFRVAGKEALPARQENGRWSSVHIPKIGWIRFRRSQALSSYKSYSVNRDRSGRWHVAFASIPSPIAAPGVGAIVGVDRGVKSAVALSTGELSSPATLRPKEAERLLRLQRRLARQRKGSNRRSRTKLSVARLKAREVSRRKDWLEKTSTDLARRFDIIRVEDLKIRQMTKSARGTVSAPGRKVRQKAALNRGILANGWGELVVRLEQKAPGRVEKINPAYTSQTCNACSWVDANSRKSQAEFACTRCGQEAHADVNAARNIAAGRAVTARGDLVKLARSVKREPQQLMSPHQVA